MQANGDEFRSILEKAGLKKGHIARLRRWIYEYREMEDIKEGHRKCSEGYALLFGENFAKIDKQKGRVLVVEACKLGNPTAEGKCHFEGWGGLKRNHANAAQCWLQAAEQGDARAQCNVGIAYESGEGIEKDPKEAFKWYLKSAAQGLARGEACLAYACQYGVGVEKDEKRAMELYERAAEAGLSRACYNIAICYEEGNSVLQKDPDKALKWYKKAADQLHPRAKIAVAKLVG